MKIWSHLPIITTRFEYSWKNILKTTMSFLVKVIVVEKYGATSLALHKSLGVYKNISCSSHIPRGVYNIFCSSQIPRGLQQHLLIFTNPQGLQKHLVLHTPLGVYNSSFFTHPQGSTKTSLLSTYEFKPPKCQWCHYDSTRGLAKLRDVSKSCFNQICTRAISCMYYARNS